MSRIGILGGSFNPIHIAHLILAERACEQRSLDKVFFVPARVPPHKLQQPLAAAKHRMRMVELAIESNASFEASSLELQRKGPSYTLLTVRRLRERLGATAELFLLLGADSVHDMPTWWHAEELVQEAGILAFDRPGYSLQRDVEELAGLFGRRWAQGVLESKVSAPLMGISATEIRERVAAGKSIRYMVPEPVRDYILHNRLYAKG